MSTELCISLLKKLGAVPWGIGGSHFLTNYYSKCPELYEIVHKMIKHQIWYKATQRYTNPYQDGNYRVAVV